MGAPALTTQTRLTELIEPAPESVQMYKPPDGNAVRISIAALVQSISASEEQVDDETPLMEAGLDSLSSVQLRTQLQQEFGFNVGTTSVFNYPSVAALSQYIV